MSAWQIVEPTNLKPRRKRSRLNFNRIPTQTRLGAFKDEEFEEHLVVMDRDRPFFIVIRDGEFVSRPGTARYSIRVREVDSIVEAHRYLESNQQIGKIVVTV
jgi:hypothetical protein